MAALEARPVPGPVPAVTDTPAGPLVVFRHPDGSVTRFSSGTRFSLRDAAHGPGVEVHLESGSSWHRVSRRSAGDGYRLVVTPGTVSINDATAVLVCQPDGECFIGAVAGRVHVAPRSAAPVVVDAEQVAWVAPAGDVCLLFDDMDLDELEEGAWIDANLALDRSLPPSPPVLHLLPTRSDAAAVPNIEPERVGAGRRPSTDRAVPRGSVVARPACRGRAVSWALVAAGVVAPVLTALAAAGRL